MLLLKRIYDLLCKLFGSRSAFFVTVFYLFSNDLIKTLQNEWAKVVVLAIVAVATGIYVNYIQTIKIKTGDSEIEIN